MGFENLQEKLENCILNFESSLIRQYHFLAYERITKIGKILPCTELCDLRWMVGAWTEKWPQDLFLSRELKKKSSLKAPIESTT